MSRVGIVAGLAREARCLAPQRRGGQAIVRVVGASAERAEAAAHSLLADGCEGLVSFGIAGGLDPRLGPGHVLLARQIVDAGGEVIPVSLAWRDRLLASLSHGLALADGDIAGSGVLTDSVRAKAALHAATGAVAVDMESLAVARVAAAAAMPFVAVRAVADPADRAPPAWTMGTVRKDGTVDALAALRTLAARPGATLEAWTMGRDSHAALGALRRVALLAGPLFSLR